MKKLYPLLIAVILILCSACSDNTNSGGISSSSPSTGTNLSTYTNEAEGLTFKYPEYWEEGNSSDVGEYFNFDNNDGMTMIAYLLAPTVGDTKQPIMNIRKAQVSQEVVESILSATLSNIKPEGNMMVTEIEDIAIGDVSARKFTLDSKATDGTDLTIIRYIYFIGSSQYRIEFYTTTSSLETIESSLNAIMESYTITLTEDEPESENAYPGEVLFEGVPVSGFFDYLIDDVLDAFGDPLERGTFEGSNYFIYDNITFFCDGPGEIFQIVTRNPEVFEINGVTLDKNRAGLITALGEPGYEDWVDDDGFRSYMMYYLKWEGPFPVEMYITLSDPDDKAYLITVEPYSDGLGDDDWEDGDSGDSGELLTGDGYTISSGDTVYAGGPGFLTVLEGQVTSINSDGSVNVTWDAAIDLGVLNSQTRYPIITEYFSSYYIMGNGATMSVTKSGSYSANKLFRYADNAL